MPRPATPTVHGPRAPTLAPTAPPPTPASHTRALVVPFAPGSASRPRPHCCVGEPSGCGRWVWCVSQIVLSRAIRGIKYVWYVVCVLVNGVSDDGLIWVLGRVMSMRSRMGPPPKSGGRPHPYATNPRSARLNRHGGRASLPGSSASGDGARSLARWSRAKIVPRGGRPLLPEFETKRCRAAVAPPGTPTSCPKR